MGAGNCFPRSFKDDCEMAKWYVKTPKWKLAEMLVQYASLKLCHGHLDGIFLELEHEAKNPYYSKQSC
jgi:hypothetical protein